MRLTRFVLLLTVFSTLCVAAWEVPAQQVTVSTPFHSLSDSFFERTGTHWGFNWKGINFSFGGPNMAVPPFGGFDPNAGINGGFAIRGGDFNGFFNFSAGQGYRQSFVTQAPSVTLTSGYPGYFGDTSVSPFVVSFIPVVGGFPTVAHPYSGIVYPGYSVAPAVQAVRGGDPRSSMRASRWDARQALDLVGPAAAPAVVEDDGPAQRLAAAQLSSAGRAVPSVAEARRLYELERASRQREAMVLYERGRTAEEGGKPNVAKIYYQKAARRTAGKLREQIVARLKALNSPGTP